jgi:hypothetical protein
MRENEGSDEDGADTASRNEVRDGTTQIAQVADDATRQADTRPQTQAPPVSREYSRARWFHPMAASDDGSPASPEIRQNSHGPPPQQSVEYGRAAQSHPSHELFP